MSFFRRKKRKVETVESGEITEDEEDIEEEDVPNRVTPTMSLPVTPVNRDDPEAMDRRTLDAIEFARQTGMGVDEFSRWRGAIGPGRTREHEYEEEEDDMEVPDYFQTAGSEMEEKDVRTNPEEQAYVIKKKLVPKDRLYILGVMDYYPDMEDLKDEFGERFGGGDYKLYVCKKTSPDVIIKRVGVFKLPGPPKVLNRRDATKVEEEALERWKKATGEAENTMSETSLVSMFSGDFKPRTMEEYLLWQKIKEAEEAKKREERLQQKMLELQIELVKAQSQSSQPQGIMPYDIRSLAQAINEIRSFNEMLGIESKSGLISFLTSDAGKTLIQEIRGLANDLADKWDESRMREINQRLARERKMREEAMRRKMEIMKEREKKSLGEEVLEEDYGEAEEGWFEEPEVVEAELREAEMMDESSVVEGGERTLDEMVVETKTEPPPQKEPKKERDPEKLRKAITEKILALLHEKLEDPAQIPPRDVVSASAQLAISELGYEEDPKTLLRATWRILTEISRLHEAAYAIDNFILRGTKTPKEAAAWLAAYQPEIAEALKGKTYDELIDYTRYFEGVESMKETIKFYKSPEVKKVISELLEELRKI